MPTPKRNNIINYLLVSKKYEIILRRVKSFLLSKRSREFFIFLFFFLIASAFWLVQTLDREYEIEVNVPIRLKNVPENMVITSDFPEAFTVNLRDKGTTLLNYQLTKRFYPISVDFTEYQNRSHHVTVLSSAFQRSVTSQLNGSTRVLSMKPDTLEYYYSEGRSKKVPVRLQARVAPGLQYYLSDTIFSPDSVLVYAPRNALDTIKAAYTRYFEETQIEDTLHRQLELVHGRGVKFVPDVVDLKLPVDIYTEKTVEVPIEGINFPADKTLRAFPSKVKVTFHVGLSKYLELNEDDFHILVSYEELTKLDGDKYQVKLKKIPQGASQVRITPDKVDFLIEKISGHGAD